ncbi:MAG: hypothetical protein H7317_03230, partial [Pseudorhodobacter sp.]|nr:hypothetical protein [Pseudorhodobacter sp.]
MASFDDLSAADTLAHLAEHLTGPMVGGLYLTPWQVDEQGGLSVMTLESSALLMVGLTQSTDAAAYRLTVTEAGAAEPLAICHFPTFSAALSFLPVGPVAGSKDFVLSMIRDRVEVAAVDLAALLRFRLVEGNIGSLMALLKREAPRLRREAVAIQQSRRLAVAQGATLNRIGGDMSVARFVTGQDAESDADYRARLSRLRPFAAATRKGMADSIGPDFAIIENLTPLAVALHVVAAGHGAEASIPRDAWLARLAAGRLAEATQPPDADAFLPSAWRDGQTVRAARLSNFLTLDAAAPTRFSVVLLDALDSIARMAAETDPSIRLALSPAPADPFGLSVTVANFTLAQRQTLASHPLARFDAADPAARGLFTGAGFSHVRRLDDATTQLSIKAGGLEIGGPDVIDLDTASDVHLTVTRQMDFDAAPFDPGGTVGDKPSMRVLVRAIPLEGPAPWVAQERQGARITANGPSVFLVVAHALLRDGGTDPYEARIVARDPGLQITLAQWETLVETLRHICPVGIAVDTWSLRG